MLATTKLSKTELSKTEQSRGFLGRFWILTEFGLPLMKYVHKLLVECILIPLGLTAVALAADAGIKKNSDLKQ